MAHLYGALQESVNDDAVFSAVQAPRVGGMVRHIASTLPDSLLSEDVCGVAALPLATFINSLRARDPLSGRRR